MTDQSRPGDSIDVRIDAKASLAVDVDKVQRDKDRGILPKGNLVKRDVPRVLELRLGDRGHRTDLEVHRVDGRAVNVLAILWVCDPAGLSGVEGRVSPRLDVERESAHVDVAGAHVEAPVATAVEVDVVKEDDDLGRGDEAALKFDAHRGRVFGPAHVFTRKKV